MLSRVPARALTAALVMILAPVAMPAMAAPARTPSSSTALLQSIAGNYTGQGIVTSGTSRQSVRCRMTFNPGGGVRLVYSGRCSTGGTGFSLSGAIAYDSSRRAFVASMTSSTAGVSMTAVGRRTGGGLVFRGRQVVNLQGRVQDVRSSMALDGQSVRFDFSAADPRTGRVTAGSIPLAKVAP